MKYHLTIVCCFMSVVLSACTFSLAEDITPPPGYKSPSPPPTLGALHPATVPNPERGEVIYTENCAPCHGERGMGDGLHSKQLPVPVAALGLPEVARQVSPAEWFAIVTQGNLENFMPPYNSLSEQERWDVVAYAMTLSISSEQNAEGKSLYEANCTDCHGLNGRGVKNVTFSDQTLMASLSARDLYDLISKGISPKMPTFETRLSEDERWALAAYLRTLAFSVPEPTATVLPATATLMPGKTLKGTPSIAVSSTSTSGETATSEVIGTIVGSVENKTNSKLPVDLKVTLRGFDHAMDADSTPQETVNFTAIVQPDGTFTFGNVNMQEGRIFFAEVEYKGVAFPSDIALVIPGKVQLTLPPVSLYATTNDFTVLKIDQVHIQFSFVEQIAQVFTIYSISNASDKTVIVTTNGKTIPFAKFPADAAEQGFETTQDSATFLAAPEGIAMPPSEHPYGLIAFYTLPYTKKLEVVQPFALPVNSVIVFLPEGMKAAGEQLTDGGIFPIQNVKFHTYTASDLEAGDMLRMTISGKSKASAPIQVGGYLQQNILIGVGVLGVVLILAGVWLFLHERSRTDDEEEEVIDEEEGEEKFKDAEGVMDAIIALDDLHRAGKLPDDAYQKRRAWLKAQMKELL